MNLEPNDLHIVFSDSTKERLGPLSVWDAKHEELFSCFARNKTVRDGQLGHWGNCPPGEYILGEPQARGTVPFGNWFVPIEDYAGHHAMRDFHREGIGIHGGGTGLPYPFKDHQGWQVTEGCVRLQNIDLRRLVLLIHKAQLAGGKCYFTAE